MMRTGQSYRGLTLVEVLVAAALSGILLTLLVKILIPGLQIWRQTQAVSELEQNAMIARAKISDSLLNTTAESITVIDRADRQAISCLNNEGTENQPGYEGTTGDVFWRSMTLYSLSPSEGVIRQYRRELPSAPINTAFAYSVSQLDSAINNSDGRLVASKVTSLRLLPPPPEQQIWQLQMRLEGNGPRGPIALEREFNVVPRIQSQ